ncbi:MAG: dihydroorotase [Bacteroidales bacterium]|nr:dihydroorotase [Bacteroidales bacterium]
MMILHNATIVTAEKEAVGTLVIEDGTITDVLFSDSEDYVFLTARLLKENPDAEVIELDGKWLMAGGIDAHVHFRDPGLTHKADIETESRAAAAGGVTTVFDMPNTNPATVSPETLKAKIESAKGRSLINIGFHIGATNRNARMIADLVKNGNDEVSPDDIAGVKVFMGSSTGNMLVDESETLDTLFSIREKPVLVHCEDEAVIREGLQRAIGTYGDDIPFEEHERIRSRKACIKSSIKALEKAMSNNTRLVLCHISTKEEVEMVRAAKLNNPSIVAETSCNYLWFCNDDYGRLGSKVKCNPSIKTADDRRALREALANGDIDTIGSDHAPHLLSEKAEKYCKAPSGLPSIQQSLPVLLTIADQEDIPLTRIASVFSEKASDVYGLRRGKIRKGYAADIVIFDKNKEFTVTDEDQYSKCGWSPYKGETLKGRVETVIVNGNIVIKDGRIN